MATQCCTSQIFAFKCGYFSSMYLFSVISENITVSHILPKSRLVGLIFLRNHFDVVGFWSYQNRPDDAIIGPVVAVDGRVLLFSTLVRKWSRIQTQKLWCQETRNIAQSYGAWSISVCRLPWGLFDLLTWLVAC